MSVVLSSTRRRPRWVRAGPSAVGVAASGWVSVDPEATSVIRLLLTLVDDVRHRDDTLFDNCVYPTGVGPPGRGAHPDGATDVPWEGYSIPGTGRQSCAHTGGGEARRQRIPRPSNGSPTRPPP